MYISVRDALFIYDFFGGLSLLDPFRYVYMVIVLVLYENDVVLEIGLAVYDVLF